MDSRKCAWCEATAVGEVYCERSSRPACREHLLHVTGEAWWYELRDLAGIALIGAIVALMALFAG